MTYQLSVAPGADVRRELAERVVKAGHGLWGLHQEGTTLEEPESAQLLLARVHYVCGRFDAALSTLGSLVDAPRHRVAALRLRADVDRVRGDWQSFLDHVARILEEFART